jgi:uncharacterized membrane protein
MNISAKKIGIALLIISIILAAVLVTLQYNSLKLGQETCPAIIEGKPCPYHQENPYLLFIVFSALIAAVFVIGLFFMFYYGKEEQKAIKKIEEKESEEKSNERFELMISGLDKDEKKVVSAIREQEGISQSTLALRTDLHKTKLSLVLKSLGDKGFIKKVPKGKINIIYLKKG